jgi:hypothetical protein
MIEGGYHRGTVCMVKAELQYSAVWPSTEERPGAREKYLRLQAGQV